MKATGRRKPNTAAELSPATAAMPGGAGLSVNDLLSLYSAENLQAFLTRSHRTLSRYVPCAYVSGFYRRSGDGFLEERDTLGRVWGGAFMRRYAEVTPAVSIVQRHPGIKVLSTREALRLTDDELRKTPLYRDVMRPQGWRHGLVLCFWTDAPSDFPFFVLTLYRTAGQPDFSEAELRFITLAHSYLAPAISRIHQSARLRSAEAGLALALRHVRGGLVMLDWQLQVVRANAAGWRACANWSEATHDRSATAPDAARVPVEVLRACQVLRRSTITALRKRTRASAPRLTAEVTSSSGVRSTVTVVCGDAEMAEPGFVIEFEPSRQSRPAVDAGRLGALTPSELRVATLVADGYSNQEASEHLGKTIHAVKFLLHSAYKKLGVASRVRLSVLLHRRQGRPVSPVVRGGRRKNATT